MDTCLRTARHSTSCKSAERKKIFINAIRRQTRKEKKQEHVEQCQNIRNESINTQYVYKKII